LEKTALALEAAGCRVEKISPKGLDYEAIWRASGELFSGTNSQSMSEADRLNWMEFLRKSAGDGPLEAGMFRGTHLDYEGWFRAKALRLDLILKLRTFFEAWDGWLVPTSCTPAFRSVENGQPLLVDGNSLPFITAVAAHVAPFNFSGSPAVTLPAALTPEGLPICLQLVGRPWQDMPLLRLAERVEEVLGPFPTAPGF
jgi:amidase